MFSKKSQSITQADIDSLEQLIGYKLPIDFISHYLSSNGGISDKSFFYVERDYGYVEIKLFLPIKYPNDSFGDIRIEESYNKLVSIGVPQNYVPFAIDHGGNYFSLDINTNDIVMIYMDLGEVTEEAIRYLTTGFSSFIDNLEEEGEGDV
ncbi:MAG: SMI1/KNR4 family protein [Pedobacter sp.]|nr:MAG: SMI1/KNR4 family protein [Pedobacter sp.]